jgi:uracil-DNA glycosylase family 4
MPASKSLADRVVACTRCPRLVEHCRAVAREKRRAYRDESYWGRPIPPFGDPNPRLLVVGLAPGAHGANRTGRVFTGDASGDWLFHALHEAGFANQPTSVSADDGLRLRGALVTCAVRCAPPNNRPDAAEADRCRPFLVEELRGYRSLAVILALGRFAFDAIRSALPIAGRGDLDPTFRFAHCVERTTAEGLTILASYHPSRQNTQTGRLTRAMFREPFARARALIEATS